MQQVLELETMKTHEMTLLPRAGRGWIYQLERSFVTAEMCDFVLFTSSKSSNISSSNWSMADFKVCRSFSLSPLACQKETHDFETPFFRCALPHLQYLMLMTAEAVVITSVKFYISLSRTHISQAQGVISKKFVSAFSSDNHTFFLLNSRAKL